MAPLPEPEFIRLKMIELRKTQGLSQQEFGETLGLGASNISALELGRHEWSLNHLATARTKFKLPVIFFNREELPEEEDTTEILKQTTALLHKVSKLSPASKTAIYKYSRLTDEQRKLIDKMILATAKGTDLVVTRAVLALLRKSLK